MRKVLIADDMKETRTLIKIFLEKEGFKVIEAQNGQEAIDKAIAEKPDIIVLDIVMPVLDGVTTAENLFKNDVTKDIPVIISTTRGQMKDLFSVMGNTKIKDFIEKPFKPEQLIIKIKEILQ